MSNGIGESISKELSGEEILLKQRLVDEERQRNKIMSLERRVAWLEGQMTEINRFIKNTVKNETNKWGG